MKNYLKTKFSITLLLLILVCLCFNCETDRIKAETENLGIVVKLLDFNQLNTKHNITNKLNKYSKIKTNPFSKTKKDIFYNAEHDFYINTDYVKYVEHDDYHSYNFSIVRGNSASGNLENLLLSLKKNGEYDAYLITYGFTKEEFDNMDITQLKNRETRFQRIDFDTSFLSKGSTSRTISSKGGCIETWVVVERDPDEGELVGADDMHDSYFELVLESRHCSTWGSSGSTGGNSGGPSGPGGGSSGGSSGTGDDSTLSSPINQDGSDDECVAVFDAINNHYSSNSPFSVDLSGLIKTPCDENISTDEVENEKLLCIYDKITKSSKFKDLFIDTFGDSENLNIKFIVSDTLTANGRCSPREIKTDPRTKKIISADIDILINKNIIDSYSAISVARTVIHEALHAYLMVKQYGCNQGTPFQSMGDKEMAKLLNDYFEECTPLQGQHEFMFNFMIPTMSGILADIKDDFIPSNHQLLAESDYTFINENNPLGQEVSWNWNEFYKYFSMAGLQKSNVFLNTIQNTPSKLANFNSYVQIGTTGFSKDCSD